MKRNIACLLITSMFVFTTFTGCVKIVKIGEEANLTGHVEFNAGDSVAEIWDSAVLPELESKAIPLPEFLTEANGDVKSLVDKYGKYSMGTSGEINYVVKGEGTVEEVNQAKKSGYITVKLDGYSGNEVVKLQIGSVYKGSSVRDSLDFIKFGDYKNQQEWAAISQNLHKVIDTDVVNVLDLQGLKGKTIEFTGTFTANSDTEILITPVILTVK